MKQPRALVFLLSFILILLNCADDNPFLSGHIKRASDAVMTPCDPYNKGDVHTCVVFSSAFNKNLVIYDATVEELVLAPIGYFPLKVEVGFATNDLAVVSGAPERFPYFLALDPVKAELYVVRAFGDAKSRSFSAPLKQALPKKASKPYKMAAFKDRSHVVLVLSYPDEGSIEVLALDPQSGVIDNKLHKSLKVGTRPSHVALSGKRAIISDEGSKNIYMIDLSEALPAALDLDIGMHSDRILVEKRDFGQGLKDYALALESMGAKLALYNLSDQKLEHSLTLSEHPAAAYFPSRGSEPCCKGEKHWVAVAGATGQLTHVLVKKDALGTALTMKEGLKSDLTSKRNMSLSQLQIIKIIGGKVIFDPELKREKLCGADNRKMFFISSYARDKHYFGDTIGDSYEVEAQGRSCEGDGTASRFGSIENEPRARKSGSDD